MVVDDQPVARRGIRESIDWEHHGISIVAEASHGRQAIELMDENRPDIVLTDIRMPVMDGLELAEHVRSELPETEVIIVSGYEDFRYAQQAVRAGVSDYLLKPVGADELVATITRVRDRIERDRHDRRLRRSFEEIHRENRLLLRGRVVTGLVVGRHEPAAFRELMESMGVNLAGPDYQVLALQVAFRHQRAIRLPRALPPSRVAALAAELEATLIGNAAALATSERPGRFEVILSCGAQGSASVDELRAIVADWERNELLVNAGIGVSGAGIGAIPVSLRSALRSLDDLPCGSGTHISIRTRVDEPPPEDAVQIRREAQLTDIEEAFVESIVACDGGCKGGTPAPLRPTQNQADGSRTGAASLRRRSDGGSLAS